MLRTRIGPYMTKMFHSMAMVGLSLKLQMEEIIQVLKVHIHILKQVKALLI